MNILEDLWYGNNIPCEHFVSGDAQYRNALRKSAAEKERLCSGLPPQMQEFTDAVLRSQAEVNLLAEQKAFAAGFRLATQLLFAALQTK